MNKYEDMKKELKELTDEGYKLCKAIESDKNGECSDYGYFYLNYEVWYSKAIAVVKTLLPERLNDFVLFYKNDRRKVLDVSSYTVSDALRGIGNSRRTYGPPNALSCIYSQHKILCGCLDTFDSKIYNIQTLLQADIFDSEIDSAKHLLKRGFFRAAGAVCGVLIEKHFSIVCQNHHITTKKKSPTIADYNEVLKDNVYDTIEWRRIQRLGDLRNLCDHNKDREPTKEEVEELISGTERIIKTIF
ncbi:MAG: hypothetical protein IJE48_07730 [Clostridia bacterium]|nr:hypothetical protein [Clostridia bacterium]